MSDDCEEPVSALLASTKKHPNQNAAIRSRGGKLSEGNILSFAFENVIISNNKWSADCKSCTVRRTKSDKKGTTSNFLSHVRQVHPAVFAEYAKTQKGTRPRKPKNGAQKRSRFLNSTKLHPVKMEASENFHEPAVALRHAFLNDLLVQQVVIGDELSIAVGEGEGFRNFLAFAEPGWSPLTAPEIAQMKLPALVRDVRKVVKRVFDGAVAVSLTVDLRKREGFRGVVVGVTGHAVAEKFSVRSELLTVKMMPGGLVVEDLVAVVQEALSEYNLSGKVFCLVDGGFKGTSDACFSLPGFAHSFSSAENVGDFTVPVQDITDWPIDGNYGDVEMAERTGNLDEVLNGLSMQKLPPFAHTLQLVIKDGFHACRKIEPMVELLSRISVLFAAARSTAAREEGNQKSKRGGSVESWTQQLKSLREILSLNTEPNEVLTLGEAVTLTEVKLDAYERNLLQTFVDILSPFEQAVDRAQRDEHATISTVAPHVSGIYRRLQDFYSKTETKAQHQRDAILVPFLNEMKQSLEMRFAGLLNLLGYQIYSSNAESASRTFGDDLYLAATFLDPTYKDYWVEEYVPQSHRKLVEAKMRTVIKGLTSEIIPNNFESINHPGGVSVVTNKSALSEDFGLDSFRRPKTGLKSSGTIESEMAEYYHDETCDELLQHWKVYDKKYPRLARLVRRLLSVPANSSKFPLSFSDRDWADWQENAAVVSLAFLRHHKSHLPGLKTPTGMASKSSLLRI